MASSEWPMGPRTHGTPPRTRPPAHGTPPRTRPPARGRAPRRRSPAPTTAPRITSPTSGTACGIRANDESFHARNRRARGPLRVPPCEETRGPRRGPAQRVLGGEPPAPHGEAAAERLDDAGGAAGDLS